MKRWPMVALGAAALMYGLLVLWADLVSRDQRDTKEMAYRLTLSSDLRELDYRQKDFLEAQQEFAGSLDELPSFRTSTVEVRIGLWRRNPHAYVAIGWHDLWPEGVCIATDTAGSFTADARASITCYGQIR